MPQFYNIYGYTQYDPNNDNNNDIVVNIFGVNFNLYRNVFIGIAISNNKLSIGFSYFRIIFLPYVFINIY